ncbi:ABC transporter permease [Parachryseolinea silvisoli]|uniref:ABC transporter permease n=1 Tax=Parachryseolinea silvisoli TaxID=2873601 RepID=UPI002265B36A|nr:ABC transporter permease [Parachryseolinea silvisoli]MCD9018483.1 ABC transporter permease [Parachryseolinea silvisoli]
MIKNYLLLAFRNFLRNRSYTLINVLGLTIGLTACIIIFLLISYEVRFDRFHKHYDHIYRITQRTRSSSGEELNAATPYPIAKAFRNDFSQIPLVTQIHLQDESLVAVGDDKRMLKDIVYADSLFFEVFEFKVLSGNPKVELGEPGKVFLTQSTADKLLKGQTRGTIRFNGVEDLEVAGIIEDPAPESHIQFSMIISMASLKNNVFGGFSTDSWEMTASGYTYFVLPENMKAETVLQGLKGFVEKYYRKEEKESTRDRAFELQPLDEIHFDTRFTDHATVTKAIDSSNLWVMGVLGLFILMIACVNFINLATALAIRKAKEIGVRKTLGARRSQLTLYFLGETFLITLIAVLISLCVTEWTLPWLNGFLEKSLRVNLLSNGMLLAFLFVLILFTTLFSGFYPAIILSGFNPATVLKSKVTAQGTSGAGVRKVLVVFQFIIAQALIICTLVIAGQMTYFRNKPLGFSQDAIINVPLPSNEKATLASLRTRLEAIPEVQNMSLSLGPPTSDNLFRTNFQLYEKSSEGYSTSVKPVDWHYLSTYDIKLLAGRWLTDADERQTDMDLPLEQRQYVYILNEAAIKRLGFPNPQAAIGKTIITGVYRIKAEIAGVVADYHTTSLHESIEPVIMMTFPKFYYDAGIKVNSKNLPQTIAAVKAAWESVYPDFYFEYTFLDQEVAAQYRQDERTFILFKIFAGISIFIGCLGLYGLISFMANQKLKEVGIRKVMGASVTSIVMLFAREFIKLILIAFALAAPLAYYFMDKWLQGFAYRIDMPWWVFLLAVVATLVIALLTVGYRSIRAAVTNPAEVLAAE